MLAVDASDLLSNAPLDALMLSHIEEDPSDDGPSNADVQRVFRDLAMTWWCCEGRGRRLMGE